MQGTLLSHDPKIIPLRNIAIVVSVDHGKTTLVDAIMVPDRLLCRHGNVDERVMDSGDLEKEKRASQSLRTLRLPTRSFSRPRVR